MTYSLQYPHDSVNGYVQLVDGNDAPYVTDFSRMARGGGDLGNAMKFAGAFLILARRIVDNTEIEDEEGGNER